EGSATFAERTPYEGWNEAGVVEGVLGSRQLRLRAQVVAVVEHHGTTRLQLEHGAHVCRHRLARTREVLVRPGASQLVGILVARERRYVPPHGIVGACLVGNQLRREAAPDELGQHFRCVAQKSYGKR